MLPARIVNGITTTTKSGWKWISNSCNPIKYHGAFAGLGLNEGFSLSQRGASNMMLITSRKANRTNATTNSRATRFG